MIEHKLPTLSKYEISSIGMVQSNLHGVMDSPCYGNLSTIILDPYWSDGLNGIERFSHLWVIYLQHEQLEWMNQRGWDSPFRTTIPEPDPRAGSGIFTIRAPCRPSALGSCIVKLVQREGSRMVVSGLDAIDGTPVMDVKVYVPDFDAFPNAKTPQHWIPGMQRRYNC